MDGKTPAFAECENSATAERYLFRILSAFAIAPLLATLAYSFARISAVIGLMVKNYFPSGKRLYYGSIDQSKTPVALRTKKRHRAYALKIFNVAKRAKLIVANPVEDVEGYRGRKNDDGQIHVLPPEQVTSLLSAAVDAEIRPLAVHAAATLRFTSSIPFFTI
jgi:hypothetical protein